MSHVFDSSAVLAMILNEPGAEEAFSLIETSEISIVNVCEIYSRLAEAGVPTDAAEKLVAKFGLQMRAFTDAHARRAADLRPPTKKHGLSLGDRACLAHAMLTKLPVVTSDRAWADLDIGVDIRLIR